LFFVFKFIIFSIKVFVDLVYFVVDVVADFF